MSARPFAVITGDFVATGGMDVANLALARHLTSSDRETHLVAYRTDHAVAACRSAIVHSVRKPLNAYALGAPLLAATGLAVARAVQRRGGVVVVNGGGCPAPGLNWVHYVHAAFRPITGGGFRSLAKRWVSHRTSVVTERFALSRASVVVANSNRTRDDLVAYCDVPIARIRTIYYGTDTSKFRPPTADERANARRRLGWVDERPRVAFIGALGDRRKGFDVLYDAWRTLVRQSSWDADLVVVGAGGELGAWETRTAYDGLSSRISFLGFRRDVPTILAACDGLVAPTRYEAYGLGVHEALCTGLPALVSASAGVAERYPASLRALLIDDPESAAALVIRLNDWRQRRQAMSPTVRHFANALRLRSWGDMARDIVALGEASA